MALSGGGEGGGIFTADLYRKVRLACAEGMSQREAARHFGISRGSVHDARCKVLADDRDLIRGQAGFTGGPTEPLRSDHPEMVSKRSECVDRFNIVPEGRVLFRLGAA